MAQGALPGMDEYKWIDREILKTRSHGNVVVFNHLIETEHELREMVGLLSTQPVISYDTETSGLNPHLGARAIGHAFACWGDAQKRSVRAFYVPCRHALETVMLPLATVVRAVLAVVSTQGTIILHHAKFDVGMARADGIDPQWVRKRDDTSIRAILCNENEPSWGLKQLSAKYVFASAEHEADLVEAFMKRDARDLKLPFKKRRAGEEAIVEPVTYMERFGHSRVPIKLEAKYACRDVFFTLLLSDTQEQEVRKYPHAHARELAVSDILHEMEWNGLPANQNAIRDAQVAADAEVSYWLNELQARVGIVGWEPTDANVREHLFKHLKLDPPKVTGSGKESVDKEARLLLAAANPEHKALFVALDSYAKIQKIASTYGAGFLRFYSPVTGCIHPSYNQLEARDEGGVPVTGRLSSQAPNIQNIAKKPIKLRDDSTISVRRYFYVPEGYVRAYIDFSQIELRVLAWYSRDPVLLDCYANDRDVHSITSEKVTGGDRDTAKQVNFGNSYGMTEIGLAKRMVGYAEDPEGTIERAKLVLAAFFREYAGIPRFREEMAAHMRRNGDMFVSAMGRPRRIPNISSNNRRDRGEAERQMMSSIISGTAADLMKEAMIRLWTWYRRDNIPAYLRQTIHDEVIIDFKIVPGWERNLYLTHYLMTHWPMFSDAGVPIQASIALTTTTWEKKKPVTVDENGAITLA